MTAADDEGRACALCDAPLPGDDTAVAAHHAQAHGHDDPDADRCDHCLARDGRRVYVGHWAERGYDGLCGPCLDVIPRTELIRGWQIEPRDQLIGDDGTAVEILATWTEGGWLHLAYRCANGDRLVMPVHGGLTQRRILTRH